MIIEKLFAFLNKYESCLYILAWSYAVVCSAYEFSLTRSYFDDYYDAYGDFDSGWAWVGRKRDVSDLEWRIWLALVWKLVPCVLAHNFVSQYIKVNSKKNTILCCWYISSSLAFICYYLGAWSMLCLALHPICLHVLTCMCGKKTVWFTHILYLFVIHILKTAYDTFRNWLELGDEQYCLLMIAMSWTHLRSISHNMDSNEDHHFRSSYNFIQKLAYCLYLPMLFLGPLILYQEFVDSINKPRHYWTWKELRTFAINLSRCFFWLYFTELLLHFVYVNVVQYHPQVVQNLSPWALYGLGYSMGQFFLNKYVVMYGTCGTLSSLDNIKVPPKPKCIARIHLYSDMWKHFDSGLYTFLVTYIYVPVQKALCSYNINYRRLIASFLCFAFVFTWHGLQMDIFIWALLNFIGLAIESIGKSIIRSEQFCKIQDMYLSPRNSKRLHCILASPLLAMSAISNFYFFQGQVIGDIFVQSIFYGSWKVLLSLLFFLYCCCQVSTDIKSWESCRLSKT